MVSKYFVFWRNLIFFILDLYPFPIWFKFCISPYRLEFGLILILMFFVFFDELRNGNKFFFCANFAYDIARYEEVEGVSWYAYFSDNSTSQFGKSRYSVFKWEERVMIRLSPFLDFGRSWKCKIYHRVHLFLSCDIFQSTKILYVHIYSASMLFIYCTYKNLKNFVFMNASLLF